MQTQTTKPTTAETQTQSQAKGLSGVKVLLEGAAGTGKTYSIGTLVDAGLEVFYFALGNELESLIGYYSDKGKPVPPNLHWHQLAASTFSLSLLEENAKKIATLSQESLYKTTDPEKGKHDLFLRVLRQLQNFEDQCTGQTFGSVDSWDSSRVLVLDPLTILNDAAMALVVGGKAFRSQPDYGLAQDQLEKLVRILTSLPCHLVIIAHVEREVDQIFGGMKITTSLIGRALAGRFPTYFSDVILSYREGKAWYWSTATTNVDTKARTLPWADKLKPDFSQIVQAWRARDKAATHVASGE